MPECDRCSAFTDVEPVKKNRYCDDCQRRFAEVEQRGVVVEESGSEYHVTVTAEVEATVRSGREYSQAEALARAKRISDETGVDVLFKYNRTGSQWLLDEYLERHPSVRQDVYSRLQRAPARQRGILGRLKRFLS